MNTAGHIIAIGGQGLPLEADKQQIIDFIFGLSPAKKPKICFIPTATGDRQDYIDLFYEVCKQRDCEPTHISLYKNSGYEHELREIVAQQDIIFIGGGNTRNMLTLWREWKLDEMLKEAWLNGAVMSGVSAGSICWFEQGVTDSIVTELTAMDCMGWLKGSCCPHYDSEAQRRPRFHHLVQSGAIQPGIAAQDGVAFHYHGTEYQGAITFRPDGQAFRIDLDGDKVVETSLETKYLEQTLDVRP